MALALTGVSGTIAFQVPSPLDLFSNQSVASVWFQIRYTGDGSTLFPLSPFSFRSSNKLFAQFTGGTSTSATLALSMLGASGTASVPMVLVPDVTYQIAGVWTPGAQTFYLNAIVAGTRSVAGNTQTSTGVAFVLNAGPAAAPVTLSPIAIWNGYALTPADLVALRNGDAAVADIGAVSARALWTLDGTVGATPVPRDDGLKDSLGHSGYDFSVDSGGWSGTYTAPLVWAPSAVTIGTVLTGGTLVRFGAARVSNGAQAAMVSVATPPTVRVNGVDPGPLVPALVDTSLNSQAYYRLPGGMVLSASDVVTFTAATAWANTAVGLAAGGTDVPAINCVGRSAHGADSGTKTFRPGMNMNWGTDYYLPYDVFANAKYRISGLGAGNSITPDGVLTMAGTSLGTLVFENSTAAGYGANNTVANSAYPDGYYAVAWDDVDHAANPVTLGLSSASGNTIVTELVSCRNPGVNGVGQVRVYQITRVGNTAGPRVYLTINAPTKTGRLAGVWVCTPWNFSFTPGSPAVIDRSDPHRLDAKLLARFPNGIGCVRPQEAIFGAAGLGLGEYEPEDMSSMDDVLPGVGREVATPGFTQVRPWTVGASPYIYSALWGSPFQATLGAPIADTGALDSNGRLVSTITVADAATAPVLVGLSLRIDSEDMGVLAVSGTSVTVRRGSRSSTPATHSTGVGTLGSVTVTGRVPIDLSRLGNNTYVVEYVTASPHGLASGPLYRGTSVWPTGATLATNGASLGLNLSGYRIPIYVTGPSTFLIQGGYGGGTGPATTIAAPIALDPALSYLSRTVAEGSHYPPEMGPLLAKALNSDLHMTIPCGAGDDFVIAVVRKIMAILPVGRKLWLEYVNEPWNFAAPYGFGGAQSAVMSRFKYGPGTIDNACQIDRSEAVRILAEAVADEGGRGRAGDIKMVLNQFSGGSSSYMTYAGSKGYKVAALAIAPYLDTFGGTSIVDAFRGAVTTGERIDLALADVWYGVHGSNAILRGAAAVRDAYNATYGKSAVLYGYEGGDEYVCPVPFGASVSGTNTRAYTLAAPVLAADSTVTIGSTQGQYVRPLDYLMITTQWDGRPDATAEWVRVASVAGDVLTVARGQLGTTAKDHPTAGTVYCRTPWIEHQRDMVNHPNWGVFTDDFHALLQSFGVTILNHYAWTIQWSGQFAWGVYHNAYQLPGKGDGSDGKADNRLYPVTPGVTSAIPAGSTQDMLCCNPRGEAINRWMAAVGGTGGGGGGGTGGGGGGLPGRIFRRRLRRPA